MDNHFTVTSYRFHTKKENVLLIQGWFEKNDIQKNELLVWMNHRQLPFSTEEKSFLPGFQKKKGGCRITKRYFFWVELPAGWEKSNGIIRLVNRCGEKEENACRISVQKLIKRKKKLETFYLDNASTYANGFSIQGWYLNDGKTEFTVFDERDNKLPVSIKRVSRPDVKKTYIENTEEEIIGFQAVYTGRTPKKVKVEVRSGNKKTVHAVSLSSLPVKKITKYMGYCLLRLKLSCRQVGVAATAKKAAEKLLGRSRANVYRLWFEKHRVKEEEQQQQKEHRFPYSPKISIVVPLYKTPEKFLNEMIASVRGQTYVNWELCLSDGSGAHSPLTALLEKYTTEDSRIQVVKNSEPMQISENTNAALKIATGEYIAFLDHDDLLPCNALFECVQEINKNRATDLIYTDEDQVDASGEHHLAAYFKSDFNIDLLRSQNYFCHFLMVSKSLREAVGFLNPEFDGAQDYDFVLRCAEKTDHIAHIPKVLYHWRKHIDSTAGNQMSKNYAFEAGKRAVRAHYARMGIDAEVVDTAEKGTYRSILALKETPLVSVIIPNKDHVSDLRQCIESIEKKSSYKNKEILIVENNSQEEATFDYYKELEKTHTNIRVLYWKGEGFNYSDINNTAAREAKGTYLLFLNNDTEMINADCIEELLGYCQRKDVGAVGARLYYEDNSIQHAGVVVGLGGVAGHVFCGYPRDYEGYFAAAIAQRDCSALTAACLMVKRTVFEEVGGFEKGLAVAFNDVDLCLKIRSAGYLIVYNPYAELYHYESKSRGYEDTEEKLNRFRKEIAFFKSKWGDFLKQGDPYYNPNLSLRNGYKLDMQDKKLKENRKEA